MNNLRVMLIDDDADRGEWVRDRLDESGYTTELVHLDQPRVLARISTSMPDVIVIDMESPGRDMLESLAIVSEHQPTPIVMFSGEQDPGFIDEAIRSGVTAYLVGGIENTRVRPAIDAAIAQFRSFQALRQALEDSQNELTERRATDRAKAHLMKNHGISEELAYQQLRDTAMRCQSTIGAVAERYLAKQEQKQ